MALTLGTNVGFVLTAPTADPAGGDTTIDGSSVVVKDTSPAGAIKITEIGWYRGSGTNTANFEVALYSDSAGVADARLYVDATNSSSAGGWITTAVDWTITPSTAYWLGLQMDAHTGSSTVDNATSGGSGTDVRTSQTTLNNPYGGGAVADADGMYAIYALYQSAPTVSLNSPADASSDSDTTPTFDFTGTDAQGNDIRYVHQIYQPVATDNFNRADNSSTGMNLGANWTATVPGSDLGISSNQAYQTANTGDNVAFYSGATLSNDQYAQVTLATVGDSYSGLIIRANATDYVIGQAVRGASQMAMYWYNGGAYTQIGSTYAGDVTNGDILILEAIGTTFNLYQNGILRVSGTNASAPSSGRAGIAIDLDTDRLDNFECGNIVQNKVSGTDAGFANPDNGGDTDPFTSGENIQYTVQSALSAGTYYWRVRGIDPSGSNTYGAWSTARSFTITNGTNVTVNAGVQSSTFSQPSLTVTAIKNKTVSPNVQSATFSAISPTITTTKNPTVSPSVQSFTASQPSIQITVGDGVSAGVQSATFNAISPTITATRNPTVSLGVQSGVLSQISPSVTVTSNKTVSPNVQSATFTQQNITVTPIKNVSVALGVQSATFSQPSLGLTVGDGATPSVQSATFSAVSPTITTVQNRTVSTGVQSATFNLISPSVTTTTSKTVSLNVQSGVFSQPTPTITPVKNVSKAVGVQSAVFSQINPTVTAENSADSVTVSPSVQSKTFSAISPTVTTVRNVTWNAPVINLGYPKFIFDDKINLYKHITGRIYMKL